MKFLYKLIMLPFGIFIALVLFLVLLVLVFIPETIRDFTNYLKEVKNLPRKERLLRKQYYKISKAEQEIRMINAGYTNNNFISLCKTIWNI